MRVGVGARSALVLTILTGAPACGGSSFALAPDAGVDGTAPDAQSTPDAGHPRDDSGHRDAAGHDSSTDRGAVPDVVAAKDATGGSDATRHDGTAGMDAMSNPDATAPMDAAPGKDANADGGCGVNKTSTDTGYLYVTADGTGTPPTSSCSVGNPCGTLAVALSLARKGDTIYVGPGTYNSSSPLVLPDGINLVGGWTVSSTGSNWTEECNPAASEVQIVVNAQEVVSIDSSAATAATFPTITLKNLSLQNAATATTAQSLYGILAVGNPGVTSLVLDNVSVTVPSGGTGATGEAGTVGASGASGGCPEAAAGAVGTTGSAAGTGTYSATGFTPLAPNLGSAAGMGGSGPVSAPTMTCPPGQNGGTPGNGNPTACGTVASGCPGIDLVITCAPPTNSGCSGGGGSGGFAGGGGGSSIGLFLWNENAVINSGSVSAGAGGTGGTGGAGGPGGPGATVGAAGGATVDYRPGCHQINGGGPTDPMLECALEGPVAVTALPGGPGMQGEPGGQGGGGASGDSYAYYVGPTPTSATVTISGSPSPSFTPGNAPAGPGTPGGLPNGAAGLAGVTN